MSYQILTRTDKPNEKGVIRLTQEHIRHQKCARAFLAVSEAWGATAALMRNMSKTRVDTP